MKREERLILYAQQIGFLNSTMKDQPQSRMAEKNDMGLDLGLPELDEDEYLHRTMFDLKPSRFGGYDAQGAPIIEATDWPVIYPFGEATGLDADDMLILSKMCRGYVEAWREGVNPLAIEPVEREGAIEILAQGKNDEH